MAVNKSTSKIRVTKLYGTDATVGLVEPYVDMQVRHGIDTRWITSLSSGNYLASLALASGGTVIGQAYPHDLAVNETVAEYWGWPTAAGSVTAGHSGVFPNSITIGIGSGMVFEDGDGTPYVFNRPG